MRRGFQVPLTNKRIASKGCCEQLALRATPPSDGGPTFLRECARANCQPETPQYRPWFESEPRSKKNFNSPQERFFALEFLRQYSSH